MRSIINHLLESSVKITYTLFSKFNKTQSGSGLFYQIRARLFSMWMCQRFNCTNCCFVHPLGFRHGAKYFKIESGCRFSSNAILSAWDNYKGYKYTPAVTIGKNCSFGSNMHLTCINEITIGDNVLTGRWVTISDNAHGEINIKAIQAPPSERPLTSKGAVRIGNNVWIGDKVTILAGVIIGDNTIIGANSVVTKSIPANCVAAGNPAKVIKILD